MPPRSFRHNLNLRLHNELLPLSRTHTRKLCLIEKVAEMMFQKSFFVSESFVLGAGEEGRANCDGQFGCEGAHGVAALDAVRRGAAVKVGAVLACANCIRRGEIEVAVC